MTTASFTRFWGAWVQLTHKTIVNQLSTAPKTKSMVLKDRQKQTSTDSLLKTLMRFTPKGKWCNLNVIFCLGVYKP